MIIVYYFLNLILTSWLLLPMLSGLFFHIPLSRKIIGKNLINDEKRFLKMQWKRVYIFMILYFVFVGVSLYFFSIGALISTAVNCFLCLIAGRKKMSGKHPLSIQSFLGANSIFFKDQSKVALVVHEEVFPKK